ncbi:hypothetical protein KDC22_32875 [Paenibacillus tritici]|uniref:hypothetical protein n=1 Tax=Paenibacillus tritici TaxID=1873425 RepID=UPI001BA91E09|nr:hypothetical protein KDC22_32875 [Paenibacillus tritici]
MNTKETLCNFEETVSMQHGDWLVYYSLRTEIGDGEPLQAFTAIPSPEASGTGATRSVPATFGINQEDFFIIAEAMHAAIQ